MMISMLVLSVAWVPLLLIPAPKKADPKTLLAQLPPPYRTGDLAHGEQVFHACVSCHTTGETGQNLNGPNLYRIFGRKAGTKANFKYSKAMKAAGFTWTPQRVDAFVADPQAVVPDTAMTIRGVPDAKDRIDLIAYLKVASS
jgi:cytochrome c